MVTMDQHTSEPVLFSLFFLLKIASDAFYDLRIRVAFALGTVLVICDQEAEIVRHTFFRIHHIVCILAEDLIKVGGVFREIIGVRSVDRYQRGCRGVKEPIAFFLRCVPVVDGNRLCIRLRTRLCARFSAVRSTFSYTVSYIFIFDL